MKMKKNVSTSTKLEKLHENPKIKENEKQLFKFLELHIMNLKMLKCFRT